MRQNVDRPRNAPPYVTSQLDKLSKDGGVTVARLTLPYSLLGPVLESGMTVLPPIVADGMSQSILALKEWRLLYSALLAVE